MRKHKQVWQFIAFLIVAFLIVYAVGAGSGGSVELADNTGGVGGDPKLPADTLDPGKADDGDNTPSETILDKITDLLDKLL